jgi:murein L,D-transpeptidase YcbB/YkuD
MLSSGDPTLVDSALEAAIIRFQTRHGLNTDGAVGPNTLAALNTPAEKRAEQVAVNLERLRWFNRDLGHRHVIINTAAFMMSYFEDGARRFSTRTVVGRAGRFETPEFNDELEYIVVNPVWNVPRSIATNEILPELREDPAYLEKNNMELVGAEMPATEIDWSTISRGSFPWRVRQRPGPGNALGDVKFLFPNKYAIYMHDTPAKRLFAKDERDFSHGCVRLEKPFEFAHLLLGYQTADPVGTFDRLRARPGEQWVTLEQTIPVYVTYRTAWVADDGSSQFRGDIYRRDAEVAAALREAGVSTTGG